MDSSVRFAANLNETVTGDVIFTINGANYTVHISDANVAYYDYTPVNNATLTVVATFAGNERYNGNVSAARQFNVDRIGTSVTVVVDDITVGDVAVVNITVVNATSGNVTIKIGSEYELTVGVVEGRFIINVPGLTVGGKTVEVSYNGDDKYINSSDSDTFTVGQATDRVIVIAHNITYTQAESITVYVNATGNVTVTIRNATGVVRVFSQEELVDGQVTVSASDLAVGNYTVEAVYNGNVNLTVSDARVNFTVAKAAPIVTVGVENITYYDVEHITVNVNTGGNVTVKVNGVAVGDVHVLTAGQVVVPVTGLAAGVYDVEVIYNGNRNYTVASANAVFKVAKASVTVDVDVADIVVGGSEVINVTISNVNATGNVTISIDGFNYTAEIEDGRANLTVPAVRLTNGTHSVVAIYAGDNNLTGNWSSRTFTVAKHNVEITVNQTTVPSDIKVGAPVTFTVNLNETVTGDVIFTINGANYTVHIVGKDIATYTYTPTNNDTIAVVATFAGSDKYNANVSAQKEFNVNRLSSAIDVDVDSPVVAGGDAVITVNMTPGINGTVKVTVDGKSYDVAVVNGVGTYVVPVMTAGEKTVEATFDGDERYLPSNDTAKFYVGRATADVNVVVENVTYGENVPVTVFVNGTGNVTIEIEELSYSNIITIKDGKAEDLIGGIPAGNYTVKVTYNGNDDINSTTVDVKLEVSKADPKLTLEVEDIVYGDVEYIIITSNAPGNVTVYINGEAKVVELTLANGKKAILMASRWDNSYDGRATVNVSGLEAGKYHVEVEYNGNENYNKLSVADDFNVVKSNASVSVEHDDTMKVRDSQVINITVDNANASGKAIISIDGENHTVNVTNGKANFTIENLRSGNHTVTVIYEGDDNLTGSITQFNLEVTKLDADVNVGISNSTVGGKQTITVEVPSDATGQVLIDIGDEHYYANVTSGTARLEIDTLPAGEYDINVTYLGDENYTAKSASDKLKVTKNNSTVNVTPQSISVGDNEVITFTVPEDATGNITVVIGNETYTVPVSGGIGTLTIPDLAAGNHTINATYNGDGKYASSSNSTKFEVAKATVSPDDIKVVDQGNGTVVVVVPEGVTGDIAVKVGNDTYNATIENGTATITLTNVSSGTHEIEVIYSGDENHTNVSVTSKVTIDKAQTPISVDLDNIDVGQTAIITVNVPENATGNVTIEIDGVKYTANITGGKARFEIENLTNGTKTIAVEYAGDDNYVANHTTAAITVSKVTPDVKLNITTDDVGNAIINVTAPGDATGQVLVDVDGVGYYVNITDGKGQLTIPDIAGGNHTVVATYIGDDKYGPANANASFEVADVPSNVSVQIGNVTYGDNVVVEVTGPEDATGTVTVTVDGKNYTANVTGGKATVIVPDIKAGNHTVDVIYSGDDKYAPNSTSTVVEVDKAVVDPNDIKVIDQGNGTVVVVVPEGATGDITVEIDGENYTVPIVDGVATVTLTNATPGAHEIEVTYSGDENHTAATKTANVNTAKAQTPISVELDNIDVGQTAIITVNVPDNATGEVTLEIDGVKYTANITDGKARFEIDNLTSGNKTIAVDYAGDDNYVANHTTAAITVSKVTPDVKLNITTDDVGNAIINVTAPGDATGQVLVDVDGVGYYVNITDGKGQLTIPDIAGGNHTVVATYIGDDKYGPANANASFEVADVPSNVSVQIGNVTYGDNVVVEVTGPEDATGTVTVTVDGKNYTANVTGGKATVIVPDIKAGNHTVDVIYSGDDKYAPNSTSTVVEVDKAVVDPNDIKVIDQGNGTVVVVVPEGATGDITVEIDGENYTVPIVDGVATVTLTNATPGAHEIEVTYSGDENHTAATKTANVNTAKAQTPISVELDNIDVGQTAIITVNVPDNATGEVTLEIDGVKYTANITDGKARFEIDNLTSGNKTIAVDYAGDDNYVANHTTAAITVSKVTPDVKLNIKTDDVGNAIINVTAPDDATGQVLVDVDGVGYYVNITDGKGQLVLPDITGGNHEVTATYAGDDKYSSATANASFEVSDVPSAVSIKVENVTYGDNSVIEVSGPEDATGTVTVTVDGKNYTANMTGGKATVIVPDLKAGNHTVDVVYSGDDKYASNSTSTVIEVDKSVVDPDDIKVIDQGNGTVVVVVPDGVTGNITVEIDGENYTVPIEDGVATVTLTNATPGAHEIEVTYSGDENHTAATTTANINTAKVQTPISVDLDNINVGQTAIITVNVPDNATGNVTIEIDGVKYTANITGGKARFEIDNLTNGTKTIAVDYAGDDNYVANHTTAAITVSKVTPEVKMNIKTDGADVIIDVSAPDDATGQVLVDVDGVGYYVNLTDGKGQLFLPDIAGGNHDVVATYIGDDKYGSVSVEDSFEVSDVPSSVSVKVDNITYGDNAVIEVSGPEDATGSVTVTVDGKNYTANVTGGKATVIIPDIKAGNHTVEVSYSGDDKYAPSNNSASLEVSEDAFNPDDIKVIDQGNGTVVVVVPDGVTGNITVEIDGENYTVPIVDGVATVTLTNATPGTHEIEVTYSGDENYTGATISSSVTTPKFEAPISIDVGDINVGDAAEITVNVPYYATGNVTLEIDGEKYTAPIKSGKATFEINGLAVGNKTVAARYDGDDNYLANITTSKLEVSKVSCDVNVTISDIDAGENLTVEVRLPNDATGQVLIDIGGVGYYINVTDGVGITEIPNVANGTYNVVVTYTGNDKYLPSSSNASVNVTKVESYVLPTAVNITAGDVEILTFTVPDDATGTISIVIDGESYHFNVDAALSTTTDGEHVYTIALNNGVAQLTISGLTKGEYVVSVTYNGDSRYLPSSNTTQFTVNESKSDVNINDNGNGTVDIELPKNANGNVTVVIDGENSTTTVVNGTVNIDLENATPGKHNISVVYTDNTGKEYVINSTVDVPKYQTPITVNVSDAKVGEPVNVVVNVPDGVSGNISIEIDGKEYSAQVTDGVARFNLPGLSEGGKTLIVKYGSDEYYVANMTTTQFKVSKVNSTIEASSKDISVGKDEVITVSVPNGATGRVLVEINGVGYYGTVVNGKAKIVIPELPSGNYKVTINYEGDNKFLPSKTTTSFTVKGGKQSSISIIADDIVEGEDAIITVKVPERATGEVTITIDGKKYTNVVKDGKVVFVVPGLTKGKYVIKAHYSGDGSYKSVDDIGSITVKANETHHGGHGKNHHASAKEGLSLTDYPTNNPLWLLLLALLAIGSNQIRRRFKK